MFKYSQPPCFHGLSPIAASIITYLDPSSKGICPPRWEQGRALHEASFNFFVDRLKLPRPSETASNAICSAGFFDYLISAIEHCTKQSEELSNDAHALAEKIQSSAKLIFNVQALNEPVPMPAFTRKDYDNPVTIIVPFRLRSETDGRLRNLQRLLNELTFQRNRDFRVVAVEENTQPAYRAYIGNTCADYLFVQGGDRFNKAAAINAAARYSENDELLCLLDADALIDETFVDRCVGGVLELGINVLMPYTDMFFLTAPATDRIYNFGFKASNPLEGYVTTGSPGGCMWIKAGTFQSHGGLDEGFSGWGGEDRDFYSRIEKDEKISRFPGLFVHLFHERPPEIQAALRSDEPWRYDYLPASYPL